ncbi:MAG: hypothetical protein HY542_00715 [Deltaproteobacteria bacterium]|nr:hypothetical protein [Deltaproteobacteria bacterium]
MGVVAGPSRSVVSGDREPDLQQGLIVPLSSGKLAKEIASGFIHEAVDSFRSLFSVQGAVFAAGITILSAQLPRLAKVGLYVGVASGLWNLISGASTLIRGDDSVSEEAAEKMGRGLFYTLPLIHTSAINTNRWIVRKAATRRLQGSGVIATEDEVLARLSAELTEGPLRKMVKPLPPKARKRIWKAMERPTFSTAYDFLLAESFLPLAIKFSYHYKNPRWRQLQPLTGVILKVDQLHEGRHLRAAYEKYPELWRYCVERRSKDDVAYPMDLLRQFFARHSEKSLTIREIFQKIWSRDRKKIWQAARFWGVQRTRPEERLCFAEEYRAVRGHLSCIDWIGTFERYKGLYYSQRGETSWVQRVQDWRIFRQLRRSVESILVVPLAVSESQYLRYRTRVYEHFNFYTYSETDLTQGLYLYFCLNDRGARLTFA